MNSNLWRLVATTLILVVSLLHNAVASVVDSSNVPADSGAPMWGIDIHNSWQSPYTINPNRPSVVWEKSIDRTSAVPTAMSLDTNGGLFVPGRGDPFRRIVATGDADPAAPLDVARDSTAAHSASGQTYLWQSGSFKARDSATGSLLWTGVPTNVSDGLPPKIGPDGTIFVPEISGQLFRYSPDGNLIYSSQEYGGSATRPGMIPAIDESLNVYFATGSQVISLDSEGNERWNVAGTVTGGTNASQMILAPDGNLYHVGFREIVGRNANTGEIINQIPELGSLQAISGDGLLYFLNPFEGVRAVSLDGTEVWNYERRFLTGKLVVDNLGQVLLSDELGNFLAISNQGELLWELHLSNDGFPVAQAPTILPGGQIVVQQRNSIFLLAVPEPLTLHSVLVALPMLGFLLIKRRGNRCLAP